MSSSRGGRGVAGGTLAVVVALVLTATPPVPARASERPVSLFAGYRVVLSPSVPLTDELTTLSYTLLGSAVIRSPGKPDLLFTLRCVGKETYKDSNTVAGDHGCVFIDKDGDQLRTSLDAAGPKFTFTLKGGTGKWRTASGRLAGTSYQTPHDVQGELLGLALGEGVLDSP